MNNQDPIQQYLKYRTQLQEELTRLKQQISLLTARQEELQDVLAGGPIDESEAVVETELVGTTEELLLDYLEKNQNATRVDLTDFFSGTLDARQLTNLLSRLSKRGVIANKGTKRNSRWHLA